MAEVFDIRMVKEEFLKAVYEQYLQIYSEKQFEASVILLTEFCNNIYNNDLALVRMPKEQLEQQLNAPVEPAPRPANMVDPFQAETIRKEVEELNTSMRRITPEPTPEPTEDIDIAPDRKKSFVEKVRDLRTMRKNPNRINPED